MNIFTPPPETEYNVLSLGAGVQSSALALMVAHGEISPLPDFAIFADTGAEPTEVYEWLETLRDLINAAPHPFPVYTVKKGSLEDDQLKVTISAGKGTKPKGSEYVRKLIPMFGITASGEKSAAIGRSCTIDYKVKPINKYVKRVCNIPRNQKTPTVTMMIGISWDEIQRAKESKVKWSRNRWPLLEHRLTRAECIHWMYVHDYPVPPRSACYFCPFHSDFEWRKMRNEDAPSFDKAVKFDAMLRQNVKENDEFSHMDVYLHRSCKPLDQIDFDNDEDKGQQTWDFQSECEGMCGV